MKLNNLSELENRIGYEFVDIHLLEEAMTHSSYVREHIGAGNRSNERLEFLGDAFLDAIAGEELYRRLPDAEEGRLTKLRAAVVCEKTLAQIGEMLQIGEYMQMGNGEARHGGRHRESIVADAMEALIGAVYLDSGYDSVRNLILGLIPEYIDAAIEGKLVKDYKSALQEKVQALGERAPEYRVTKEEGPPHDRVFYVDLLIHGKVEGKGVGKTKKQAEQNAARQAIERGTY